MQSIMKHNFSQVPKAEVQRSVFDRSHGRKTTFFAGHIVPIYCDEALPGDTFNMKATMFARMGTTVVPIMDNLYADIFFFAVPMRLLWENWEKFCGAQDAPNPDFDDTYDPPYIVSPDTSPVGYQEHSLYDYLGIPTKIEGLKHSALWCRAYNLIYNEWFRDQNNDVGGKLAVNMGDGEDDYTDYDIQFRCKRHDYFTSCLPWPQKGPSVLLPLGDDAPVTGIGKGNQVWTTGVNVYETDGTTTTSYAASQQITGGASDTQWWGEEDPGNAGYPNIRVDLSQATAATINELRQAFQIQKMYERDGRGGTRYTEVIRSHFGVTSPDFRMQRPEYLGGGSQKVTVHPVVQTSVSAATPKGDLSAFSTVAGSNNGFVKSFTEHCILLGLVSVRADLTYQQGLSRMFSRETRFDYYWPALAHLGEQAVLNKEIYAQGLANPTEDEEIFGFQERYAEYRYKPSEITGLFRSNATGTLEIWHLSQDFSSLPVLDQGTFIFENPPLGRVMVAETAPHFLADFYFDLKCARPMPTYSVPGLIDHF